MPAFFASLAEVDYPRDRLELHLVDNGAGDGTLAAARREIERLGERLPAVVVHEPGANLGFAGGNNLALRAVLDRGADYAFLLNPDATFEPPALREAVRVAEHAADVGSVQSLLVLGSEPEVVNTSGNHIHFLGFGYVGGYLTSRAHRRPASPATSPSPRGPACSCQCRCCGGWGSSTKPCGSTTRIWISAGACAWPACATWSRPPASAATTTNSRAPVPSGTGWSATAGSWCSRTTAGRPLLLLLPIMVLADLGLLVMAAKAGWLGAKLRSWRWFLRPSAWAYLWHGRRAIARLRRVPDRELLRHFTAVIDYPDFRGPVVTLGGRAGVASHARGSAQAGALVAPRAVAGSACCVAAEGSRRHGSSARCPRPTG